MRRFIIAVAMLGLLGCGGSSTVNGPGTVTPAGTPSGGLFTGSWHGQLTSANNATVQTVDGLILADGTILFYLSAGPNPSSLISGTIAATGTTQADAAFTGEEVEYAPAYAGGVAPASLGLSGTLETATSIMGTYAGGGDHGTLYLGPSQTSLYTQPLTLATLAGPYQALAANTGVDENMVLAADGTFTGSDANGTFSGALTVVDPTKNAFTVTLTYQNTQTSIKSTYTGLAFVVNSLTPTSIYLLGVGANGAWAAEFAYGSA